ncbi:extracellular solute-binding protein [Paenibacillus sp. chi10]|uniref:Extracellular solute-binding protein n=1 Tax=Paenibacillus suaedae TaxID=3077233 RepID=A0AAJ2N5P6_9BACL|nr:extracellular solute-binding protein [Paenibacillus sp. chi10]MDT8978912.1 extracellular solute-binding protein [Paenibacillus sp. chi10]
MKRVWRTGIFMLTILSLLSSCAEQKEELEPLQAGTIKVVYLDEESFYEDYGKYFKLQFPQIDVEVISKSKLITEFNHVTDYKEATRKFLNTYSPDVLLLDEEMFKAFVEEGKLYNLETAIHQDNFDVDGFMPGLIDKLKALGKGDLYGLVPRVIVHALYYNADLFKEYQVEPPRNKMTWQELMELAARFAGSGSSGQHVYGLEETYSDPGREVLNIGFDSGLRLFDEKADHVLINTDGWKSVMKLVTDGVRSGSVILNSNGSNKHFMNKEAAMIFGSPDLMLSLKQNGIQMNWGIATMPVHSNDESVNISSREIFAISAASSNKRAAWELVKFVNGADMAKSNSKTYNGTLPSRTGFLKEYDGKSLEAFYMLKVRETAKKWGNAHVPEPFFRMFVEPMRAEMQAVIENRKTVDEAAAVLEEKGQAVLMQARSETGKRGIVDRKR